MFLFLGQTKMVLIDSPTDLIATASRQIPQLDMKMERFGLAATGVRESYMIEWREDIRPKRRPCTFGQSLWCTNCPVNFSFFWSTKFFLVYQIFFCYTKYFFGRPNFFFGQPNFFLVYQNFFLLYQNFFWSTKIFFWSTKKMRN